MMKKYVRIVKMLARIGVAISLVLVITGVTSPACIFGGTIRGNVNDYEYAEHSGPYQVIVSMYNWSVKIWFSEHINGKYNLIWSGTGKYPSIGRAFIPSRGYIRILANTNGSVYFQRIRPALQYDYFYEGLYSLVFFSSVYAIMVIYGKHYGDKYGRYNN